MTAGIRLSDDDLLETIEAVNTAGSMRGAARALGLDHKAIRDRMKRAAERGLLGAKPVLPGFRISKTTAVTDKDGNLERQFVQQRPEVGEEFAAPDGHVVRGVSALVDSDGRTIQQWIKTRAADDALLATIRAVVDELKKELVPVTPSKGPEQSNAVLLNQYTITDLHFGMLAWSEETGKGDYDLKIAEKLLLDWFSAAIAMSPNAAVGILAQLGDLMHHDALESVTPAHKHVLDADSRLQKIIRVVIRVVRQIIGMMLQKYPNVHIIMASANHDPASSAWMRELLHAMYDHEPRLTVDNSPDVYYAYEWGKTGLFYHHGHKRNVTNVDSVFAGKFREMFGRCPKCYGHIGHFHSDQVRESNLMRIERHRTLAPPDAHSSSGGWLSERDAKVITYHKSWGEVSRITISPQMVEAA